ncbi:hypothetical protein Poli38472_003395 [Pythium oligandrum]|uniref:Uncharacterized protein n=1 Tax=Pythium oligandrum TaxID=41045 RepID=A0A8K1C6Z7_PYTOL|nr:hypothetical protein Poli38472_003395 [Pythium oligandrum]|eukprot:TMW57470.1 hypothetical protein Poli38472_003395 [Pythium oligandrum]
MEKRRRWTIRVALDDAELRAKDSLFVEMCELLMRRVDAAAARVKTAVVLVQATGEHHFNALEQLSRLCFEHRIWNGVFQPLVNQGKQMVAYVPRYSSSGSVQREIERLGSTVGLTVATQVETFDDVPMLVIDTLVQALLFQEIQGHGAMVFGDAAVRQIVFADLNQTTEVPTVAISHPQWHIDPYRRSIQITMTCVPATMALTTLAMNSTDLAGSHIADNGMCESRIQVLPGMTECFVVSRHDDPPAPTHLLRASWCTGLQRYVPTSEQEFRDYWSNVHGIDLPEDIGGFVRATMNQQETAEELTPSHDAPMETEDALAAQLGATATKSKLEKLMHDFSTFDDVMRIGTRQRRERDEYRLAEMKEEMSRLEKKLEAEVRKRVEMNKSLQNYCDEQVTSMIQRFQELLDARAKQVSDRLDGLATEIQQVQALVDQEKREIPLMIERKTNELTQKLVAFMDAFDQERLRRMAQEEMILKRLSDHEHATAEAFDRERRDRETKYAELKSALDAYTTTRNRGDERFQAFVQSHVARIQNGLVTEAQAREREDDEIIEALNRYTAKLQDSLQIITRPDA